MLLEMGNTGISAYSCCVGNSSFGMQDALVFVRENNKLPDSPRISIVYETEGRSMHKLLVADTTYDGHAVEIAKRIESAVRQYYCAVELCDLAHSTKPTTALSRHGIFLLCTLSE